MRLGDPLTDRQTEPQAASSARPSAVNAVEPIEQIRQVLPCDALTSIRHGEDHMCSVDMTGGRDSPAGAGVPQGILKQVDQELSQQTTIPRNQLASGEV